MNDPTESDAWYFLTQYRLHHRGINVGVDYTDDVSKKLITEMEARMYKPFEFSSEEHYLLSLIKYSVEAADRDELTEDVWQTVGHTWYSNFQGQELLDEIDRLESIVAGQDIGTKLKH